MSKPESVRGLKCTKQNPRDSREALAIVWFEVRRAWTLQGKGEEKKQALEEI